MQNCFLGIGTQGQVTDGRWVSRYGITYSANVMKWTNYTENNKQKVDLFKKEIP